MSTQADTAVKPAEEFVVYTDDSITTPNEDKTSAGAPPKPLASETPLSLDTSVQLQKINRIDSFPKTLPLPASSILSPISAAEKRDFNLPPLSEQQTLPPGAADVVSPPETTLTSAEMLVQTNTPLPQFDEAGTSTPLAELAGTDFDQQVAMRRRGDSILGEEVTDNISNLKVEDETTPVATTSRVPAPLTFTKETLEARQKDPAVVSALPQTPSAEDFEVAKTQVGSGFTPEYPTETKVAS
ncbi:hypothetical protein ABW20_dc0109747 [Dactylellina cionopaga]|nr:hypothetical protein ABW20_dc0109747 [Dactylellina cionopaga]